MTITRISVLLILFTCAFHFAKAQTIPNGDFEIWVAAGSDCENPKSWDSANETLSFFAGICSVEKESTLVQDGSTAARLETKVLGGLGIVAPAALALGTIVVDIADPFNGMVEGGVPTWEMASSMTFYYSYAPQGGDSMTVRVRMLDITGSDTTIISEDEYFSDVATGAVMEEVIIDINYTTSDDPELVQIIARSSRDTDDATPGSTLILDGFRLNGITSVGETENLNTPVIYPNPASEYIAMQIDYKEALLLQLTDVNGKIVLQEALNDGFNKFDISKLSNGFVVYRIINSAGVPVRTGKLVIGL